MGKVEDEQGFRPIGTKRNFELVIRHLQGMLESGRLKPGDKLPSEPDLASRFEVSRTALREALKVLELSGYLQVKRGYGGGTFVARPTGEEFRTVSSSPVSLPDVTPLQLFQVCVGMEPQAARIAAAMDLRETGSLEDANREMSVFDDRPARVMEANFRFHRELAKASGNPVFVAMLQELKPAVLRHLNLKVRDGEWRSESRREHAEIVAAIKAKDPDEAERKMKAHVERELRL